MAKKLPESANVGLDEAKKIAVCETLTAVQADLAALYAKSLTFHWNVRGPAFVTLHEVFKRQFEFTAKHLDKVSEIIRGFGSLAPAFTSALNASSIRDGMETATPEAMVVNLLEAYEGFLGRLREWYEEAEENDACEVVQYLEMLILKVEHKAWKLRVVAGR